MPSDRAAAVYQARIVQVRTWRDAVGESLFDLLLWMLPLPSGEARYNIVVGRRDGDSGVGVREARRRRDAQTQLLQVQALLESVPPDEARQLLQLES